MPEPPGVGLEARPAWRVLVLSEIPGSREAPGMIDHAVV